MAWKSKTVWGRLCSCVFLKGILVRIVFGIHNLACVAVVNVAPWVDPDCGIVPDDTIWPVAMCGVFMGLLLVDAFCSLFRDPKKDICRKYFSPTIALYIIFTVPWVWLIELKQFDFSSTPCHKTILNNSFWIEMGPVTSFAVNSSDILLQAMMIILIVGRWLLPHGKLSRDQLLQLVLMQIGKAADSLEFLTDSLAKKLLNREGVILVLSFWTWSLPQFTLTLNLTKTKKPTKGRQGDSKRRTEDCNDFYDWPDLFFATEMWSIFLQTFLMEDFPFLVVRLYLIISSLALLLLIDPIVYFAAKNVLVILVQSYRMAAIVTENRRKRRQWQTLVEANTEKSSECQQPGLKMSPKEDPKKVVRAKPGVYEYAWYVMAVILQIAKSGFRPFLKRKPASDKTDHLTTNLP